MESAWSSLKQQLESAGIWLVPVLGSAAKWFTYLAALALALSMVIAIFLSLADGMLMLHYKYTLWSRARKKLQPFGTSPLADAEPADLIVTLVHGTWAPDAEWTHEHSPLRAKLTEGLAGLRVAWHVLDWSGGNNVTAREHAAKKLAGDLHALAEKHPRAAQVVIAHSHGGNAVMYALRDDPAICERLAGVICIATPFLHVRERDLDPFDWRFVRAAFAGVVALPIGWFAHHYLVAKVTNTAAAGAAAGHGRWYEFPAGWLWPVTIAALVLGTLAGWKIAEWCEGHARNSQDRLALPSGNLPPMLVIRAIADEASAVLSVVFAGGLISAMFWERIARLAKTFARRAGKVQAWETRHWRAAAGLALGGIAAIMLGVLLDPPLDYLIFFAGFLVLVLDVFLMSVPRVLNVIAQVLAAVLLVPYGAFVSFLATGVSPGLALAGIYLEVVAEALPLGSHGVTLYNPKIARQKRSSVVASLEPLMHSRLYSDPAALADIAAWIRARVEA